MDIGTACGLKHFFLRGVGAAIEDIFTDGACEKENVLLDNPNVPADGFHGQTADVHAVNQDGAVLLPELVKIGKQMAECGFSAAGGAHQGQLASLFQAQIDVVEDFLRGIIGVSDIFKLYGALHIFKLPCIRRIRLGLLVHELHKAFEAADAVLELLHEADQGVYRIDKQVYRNNKGRVIPKGYSARIQKQAACDQDKHIEYVCHKGSGGVELGHGMVSAAGGIHK